MLHAQPVAAALELTGAAGKLARMKAATSTRESQATGIASPGPRRTIEECNLLDAMRTADDVRSLNPKCLQVRVLPDGTVAMLQRQLFTHSIALGCHRGGWAKRFCFEDRPLAERRFDELRSEDDVPPGHIASRVGRPRP